MRKIFILFTLMFYSLNSYAIIISGNVDVGTGDFIKLNVPFTESNPDNTVGNNTFQDPNLYGFDEGQNILLTSDLNVDILASTGLAGTLSSGTVVASHYVFFDPRNSTSQEGTVTFDSTVLAIITSTANLSGSDFLINNGVTYQNPGLRGLESGDSAFLTNAMTVGVDWRASTPGDYIRVLTEFSPGGEVPLPASVWFLLTGVAGLGVIRKRLQTQRA